MTAMHDAASDRGPDTALSGTADTWPLSAREAAALLGVHERTIRRAIARGELRADKRAGTFRIAREDLDRYRARRPGPATLPPPGPALQLISFPGAQQPRAARMPQPLTSLVGRETGIADVRALLTDREIRLVTLTGPGGVGKTRLALAASRAAEPAFELTCDVDLAPVRDPRRVAGAIARALGVRGRGDRPLIDRVAPALRGRRALLLIDNFEHVTPAALLVSDLLGAFPELTVLATSRARLRLSGEHEYVVSPLDLDVGNEAGQASAAARLFIDRARAVVAGFAPSPHAAAAIEAICRRLDALPLAIELAAVRINVVTPETLLDRLEQRLPLLTGGARDLPARQRTMRDTVAWSYDLLRPREQALFRWLSVYVGGFSLAAVDHSMAALRMTDVETVSCLGVLVDASLLRVVEGNGPQSRYTMLETMREYGREILEARSELGPAQDAHAAFYLHLDDWLDPNVIAPGVTVDDRLREIEPEHANLEAALSHLASSGDMQAVRHLAGQCAVYWHHRGYLPEGRRWLELALDHTDPGMTADRGLALAGLSLIRWTQVDLEAGIEPAKEALAIGRAIGHAYITALALHMFGLIENALGEWERARAHMDEARELWQRIGARSSVAMALVVISACEFCLGDLAISRQRADAALAIFQQVGHDSGTAFSLVQLGRIAEREKHDRLALALHQEGLTLWAGIGERWAIISALVGVAGIAAAHGRHEAAAILIGAVDARIEESGGGIFPIDREAAQRAVGRASGALGQPRFAGLRAEGRELAMPDVVAAALAVDIGRDRSTGPDALSPREREVLRLVVDGKSNAEIADALFITVRTARAHVESILAKLDVSSRTAAATHAVRHHLV